MIAAPNLASWNIAPTKRADAILKGAVEKGINAFDTARVYWSEGVVGRFVRRHPLGRGAFRFSSTNADRWREIRGSAVLAEYRAGCRDRDDVVVECTTAKTRIVSRKFPGYSPGT